MLREKLNLKMMFCLLNIIAFIIFYMNIDIQLIDVFYLVIVLFFIIKCIYVEKNR